MLRSDQPILEVQLYLETHSFEQLYNEWGIAARVSSKNPRKVCLNYDMIKWKKGHKPSEQCRGLILLGDTPVTSINGKPTGSASFGPSFIIGYPFDKFYNLEEEGYAAPIDWSTARVVDKLDGTLITLYYDPVLGEWCTATRSVPDADIPLDAHDSTSTFSEYFKKGMSSTTGDTFEKFISNLDTECCYMFEFVSLYNQVIVAYRDMGIVALGCRRLQNLIEISCAELKAIRGWRTPQEWHLKNPEDISKYINSLSAIECEGAVIVDARFNRIKMKSRAWLEASALKDNLGTSTRNIMRYILTGTDDDVIALLPTELVVKLETMREQVRVLFKEIDIKIVDYIHHAGDDRKFYAELVNLDKCKWKAPFFQAFRKPAFRATDHISSLVKANKLNNGFIDTLLGAIK